MALPGEPPATRDLVRGELFAGRYQIDDRIGLGGMGAVYRAHDTYLGESVALKILDTGRAPTPTAIMRFREEVKLGRRVTHKNVVRVYDIGECEGLFFLTMELFEGTTLRSLLKAKTSLDTPEASAIIVAVAEGLCAIHTAGIVHRDLKPENVLIHSSGRVAISDFGIARNTAGELSLTQGMLGTPMYMAPEQAGGGQVDARTDLYAFGTLAYEMLTGTLPFCSVKQINDKLIAKGVSQVFASFVIRCLERDQGARPSSITELLQVINPHAVPPATDRTSAIPSLPASRGHCTPPRETSSPTPPAISAITSTPQPLPQTPQTGQRSIAILPLRYVGVPDHAYIAEVLGEELVDSLSRVRGLFVLGMGATSKYKNERDAQKMGQELNVFAVIDGTVQLLGSKFRISVRLLECAQGIQKWSSQSEGGMADLLELQTSIAQRIAEELRAEISTLTYGSGVPAEAIEIYLTGRKHFRTLTHAGIREAASMFARCIALAPDFKPALAAHAHACLRMWFLSIASSGEPDWETLAKASVERSLTYASDLAETQLTASMLATQNGDFRMAVHHAARALVIAPTFADALEYLGMLECEAGRSRDGSERIALAIKLNPALLFGLYFLARTHVMKGEIGEADAIMKRLEQSRQHDHPQLFFARIRLSAWQRNLEYLRYWVSRVPDHNMPVFAILRLYAAAILGDIDEAQADKQFARILADTQNPRMSVLVLQLATEAFGSLRRPDRAMLYLMRAAVSVFVDVEWMDFCPLLEDMRGHPKFAEARRKVVQRSEALWAFDHH